MNWTEALCQLYARRHPDATEQEFDAIRKNEAVLLQQEPLLLLYRRSLRTRALRTDALDGFSPLAMSSLEISPDVIYIDDAFYTIAQTELELPQPFSLQMQGKAPGGFSLFRKKDPLARWKVKGNLTEATTVQIAQIVQRIDPEYPHFYEISLFPHEDAPSTHTLLVRSSKLPWELGTFSTVANYILTDEAGRRLKSNDSAVMYMEHMIRIALDVRKLFA